MLDATQLASEWMVRQTAPVQGPDVASAHAVANFVQVLELYIGPWFAVDTVNKVQGEWLELIQREHDAGSDVASRYFAASLHGRATLLGRFSGLDQALELLPDARLQSLAPHDRPWLVRLLATRSDLQRVLGRFSDAFEGVAAARAVSTGASLGLAEVIAVEAKLELDLGRVERAQALLVELSELAGGAEPGYEFVLHRELLQMSVYIGMGRAEAAMNAADAFVERHVEALMSSPTGQRLLVTARVFHAIARMRGAQDPDAAQDALAEIKALLGPAQLLSASARAQARLAAIDGQVMLGSLAEARRTLAELDGQGRLEGPTGLDPVTENWSVASSALLRAQVETRRARLARKEGSAVELGDASRRLRAALDDLIRVWAAMPRLQGGMGFLEFVDRREAIAEYIEAAIAAPDGGGAARALECLLQADACSTTSKLLEAPLPTLAELIQYCREENATLTWLLPGDDLVHRLVVDRTGVTHAAAPGAGEVEPRLRGIRRALDLRPSVSQEGAAGSAWPPASIVADLAWLADRVLPARFRSGDASDEVLIVIGAELLGNLPLEVLPAANGVPLGLLTDVVRAPSASALLALSRLEKAPRAAGSGGSSRDGRATRTAHRGPRRPRAAIFALSGVAHDLDPIDLAASELQNLEAAARTRFELTSGVAATADGLVRSMLRAEDLFVAWTHGDYDRRRPQPAGLVVAGAGGESTAERVDGSTILNALLGATERPVVGAPPTWVTDWIQRADAGKPVAVRRPGAAAAVFPGPTGQVGPPRVAFLASCETARSHRRGGDGIAGHLGGAFLGAGTSAAVVSSVKVDRDAALAFLTAWSHAYFVDGKTASGAMLAARRSVASEPRFAHPHFWGSLQLVGWGGVRRLDP